MPVNGRTEVQIQSSLGCGLLPPSPKRPSLPEPRSEGIGVEALLGEILLVREGFLPPGVRMAKHMTPPHAGQMISTAV